MDLYLSMHAVPGFLLLVSVTAHSHSHSILSIAPAQTFVQPCWESDRGIDPAKNNRFVLFFFYIPQVNFQAEQFLLWQGGGKLVGSRIRRWGWESSMVPGAPTSGYAGLNWLGHKVWVLKTVTFVRVLASLSSLIFRGSFVSHSS